MLRPMTKSAALIEFACSVLRMASLRSAAVSFDGVLPAEVVHRDGKLWALV